MAIPDYQTLMLPVLREAASGEVSVRDCIDRLAKEFKLTDEERAAVLPSGKQTVFANRVHWAKTYMAKAGLVHMPKRGHFAATDRGLSVLKQAPPKIDNSFLDQFEEFRQFRTAKVSVPAAKGQAQATAETLEAATPEERVEDSSKEIEDDLRAELLDRVVKASPAFFEKLVVDLLLAMNYGGAGVDSSRRAVAALRRTTQ